MGCLACMASGRATSKKHTMKNLPMKRSLLAAFVVAALGLLSMGGLGALLYYAAYPVLGPFYGNLDDWRGDDVWPAMIGAGMLWAFSFLAAGWLNQRLLQRSKHARRLAYAVTLWLGAILTWVFMLATLSITTA